MGPLHRDFLNCCFPTEQSLLTHNQRPHHVPIADQMRANFFGLIARSVGRKEISSHPTAFKAVEDEWTRLRNASPRGKGVWREDLVESWTKVKETYKGKRQAIHVGELLEVCVRKRDQLRGIPENYDKREYKGRAGLWRASRLRTKRGQLLFSRNCIHVLQSQVLHNVRTFMESSRAAFQYRQMPQWHTSNRISKTPSRMFVFQDISGLPVSMNWKTLFVL